ncbi:hypothetical protein I2494_04530 [Budviciaceae bacterium BWR-B9]|uniref:Abortive infection protein-like C-terminal domain-containing protein n=1 Tax=Limnobaculum allomyrinae TaxID=2791986 RepID=A0ABS1IML2_9GAMM|nr:MULTISPECIES: hypothetical protein [Limnobaculum]MBK5142989.1 hypothetical protein [Limnobaculum allomyrinae]MBV7693318.1 hypothetical protein [Limnobaculum sp. M2-1]
MAVSNLFSKRQKVLRGEVPDVYQYDTLSLKLRNQIIFIIQGALGKKTTEYNMGITTTSFTGRIYENIRNTLIREYGETSLAGEANAMIDIFTRLKREPDIELCLDIVEIAFGIIDSVMREVFPNSKQRLGLTQSPDDAITELNQRLKADGVGYEFVSGEIIRIDSQFIHSEVVKPALVLLQGDPCFEGTKSEFFSAHSHYRHGKYKETLVDCLKSFESCMKAICEKHKWEFKPGDTAKKLIETCLVKNLIPVYMQEQFTQLRCLLESGVPTIRNKEGGHGQGTEVKEVPQRLASYVLHLTAANIVFLAECEKGLP